MGKGSPTGVAFGTPSHFPPPYRDALFILDWAYGRVLAVHTAPRGASYACGAEVFLKGRPFNVTDLAFGPDGGMYLVTGGRKTQSGLYRVRYTGPPVEASEPTAQQTARRRASTDARALRRRLESLLDETGKHAVDAAWPHLGSPDPWLRQTARVVVERQPMKLWRARALTERDPPTALTAWMALARAAKPALSRKVLARLTDMPLAPLPTRQKRTALWTYRLCVDTVGVENLTDAHRRRVIRRIEAIYPDGTFSVDRRGSHLLVDLGSPDAVPAILDHLDRVSSQKAVMHDLFVLRKAKVGWTTERRRRYFRHLRRMDGFTGGAGMDTFVQKIRTDAIEALPPSQRKRLEPLLQKQEEDPLPPAAKASRDFVRDWKVEDLVGSLDAVDEGRDLRRGKKMFAAAQCVRCHRVGTTGRSVGPDLTNVARRLDRRSLLEAILRPSQVVPEKHRLVEVVTKEKKIVGRLVRRGDYRKPVLRLAPNPLDADRVVEVPKKRIRSHRRLPVSPMPEGLLDTLTKEEILDLLAYLEAGRATRP